MAAKVKSTESTELSTTDEYTVDQLVGMSKLDRFSDAALRDITSFEEAFALAEEVYGDVKDIHAELGNGFTLIDDKGKLKGVAFLILHFGLNDGEFGEFSSIAAVTKNNDKYIFNDGSSGIKEQLLTLARTHQRFGGFMVHGGLNESTYPTCFECNKARSPKIDVCPSCGDATEKRSSATTWYLDLSKPS